MANNKGKATGFLPPINVQDILAEIIGRTGQDNKRQTKFKLANSLHPRYRDTHAVFSALRNKITNDVEKRIRNLHIKEKEELEERQRKEEDFERHSERIRRENNIYRRLEYVFDSYTDFGEKIPYRSRSDTGIRKRNVHRLPPIRRKQTPSKTQSLNDLTMSAKEYAESTSCTNWEYKTSRNTHSQYISTSSSTGNMVEGTEGKMKHKHPVEMTEEETSSPSTVLDGKVIISEICDNNTVLVCLVGDTDTELERGTIVDKCYSQVQELCAAREVKCVLYDLTVGQNDFTFDDHSWADFMESQITQILHTDKTIPKIIVNFVGDKYGDYSLPRTIPVEEFDFILDKASIIKKERDLAKTAATIFKTNTSVNKKKRSSMFFSQGILDMAMVKKTSKPAPTRRGSRWNETKEKSSERRKSIMLQDGTEDRRLSLFEDELSIVNSWYHLDDNAQPPVYKIVDISSKIPDIRSVDSEKRKAAKREWFLVEKRLKETLLKHIEEYPPFKAGKVNRYTLSRHAVLLDKIMNHGVENVHMLSFKRTFTNVSNYLHDAKARDYVDMAQANKVCKEKLEKLHKLDVLLEGKVHKDYRFLYKLTWSKEGLNPAKRHEHLGYINTIVRDFLESTTTLLHSLLESKQPGHTETELFSEVQEHFNMMNLSKDEVLIDRPEVRSTFKEQLVSKTSQVIVVTGEDGSGMSSFITDVVKEMATESPFSRYIFRYIGTMQQSSDVIGILYSLAGQLSYIVGTSLPDDLPLDTRTLSIHIRGLVRELPLHNKYYIVLDRIDRIKGIDEDDDLPYKWLQSCLHEKVTLVLTTSSSGPCFPLLKQMYKDIEHACFLNVEGLSQENAGSLLQAWFEKENRGLTHEQLVLIVQQLQKCRLPLYLKFLFIEARKWGSYVFPEDIKLPDSLSQAIQYFIGRMEKRYGELLICRIFGFITAAKHGISYNELNDMLSADDITMEYITSHFPSISFRRFPTFLLLRVLQEVHDLLIFWKTPSETLMQWRHTSIAMLLSSRYLTTRNSPGVYKVLAALKQSSTASVGTLQNITLTMEFGRDTTIHNNSKRRLMALPYYLAQSQSLEDLKEMCLFNYEFLLAKLRIAPMAYILDDLQLGLVIDQADAEIPLLQNALILSQRVLREDPLQLASQLAGRLQDIVNKDIPATRADPRKYPYLYSLLCQISKNEIPLLIPSTTCLLAPTSMLPISLHGHHNSITAIATTSDGVKALSICKEGILTLWNLRTCAVINKIRNLDKDIQNILLAKKDTVAVLISSTFTIALVNIVDGVSLGKIDAFVDSVKAVVTSDDNHLVTIYEGSNIMRRWSLEREVKLVNSVPLKVDGETPDIGHIEDSIQVASRSYRQQVLYAFRRDVKAYVVNSIKGDLVFKLMSDASSAICTVGMTHEYFIVLAYCQTDTIINLYDAANGKVTRTITGCGIDYINRLETTKSGSHALAICKHKDAMASSIAVWNLATEEHRHCAYQSGNSIMLSCTELRYCITQTKDDKNINLWNVSTEITKPNKPFDKSNGLGDIVTMVDQSKYVVAIPANKGPVTVWDIENNICIGGATCTENGMSGRDILLARNTTVIVLSDVKNKNNSEDAVFTSVTEFDIKSQKYIRKIEDADITVLNRTDYTLMSDCRLLGVSSDRSHIVIWSLKTGQVKSRIYRDRFRLGQTMERKVQSIRTRGTTAKMLPWQRRSESKSSRFRRQENELNDETNRLNEIHSSKDNAIADYLLSKDENLLIVSFHANHLCVFDVDAQHHINTLIDENAMMYLANSSLCDDGSRLATASYNELTKSNLVNLWNTVSGVVLHQLDGVDGVCALTISPTASMVVFTNEENELCIWNIPSLESHKLINDEDEDSVSQSEGISHPCSPNIHQDKAIPFFHDEHYNHTHESDQQATESNVKDFQESEQNQLTVIKACDKKFKFSIKTKIFVMHDDQQVVLVNDKVTSWDIQKGLLLSTFTPDTRIACSDIALDGHAVVLGFADTMSVVSLKLKPFNSCNEETNQHDAASRSN